MPYLAGNKIIQQTDTGGGVVDKANDKNVKFTTPGKTTGTTGTSTNKAATTSNKSAYYSTGKKTTNSTATAKTASTKTKKSYTPYTRSYSSGYSGYSGGGGGSKTAEEPKTYYNDYLRQLEDTYKKEYNTITNNASNYANTANANIQAAQNTYDNAYIANKQTLDWLAGQNAQREANTNQSIANYYNTMNAENAKREQSINQSIADYYSKTSAQNAQREANINQSIANYYNNTSASNAAREAATLSAIDQAYGNVMNNANDYYNNLLDTYNRSMGYVDQGFNEGNAASMQARDEAIQLAAQLYAMGEETQNRETEKALRGQYASYMKGMRNLGQSLAAQGINGGATETSMLNALNGYEANRTDLNEAKLAALGVLRQQQMQSDSEAQQAYLAKLADLITNRTNQYLGVENNRSQGEYNYANMKNSAESDRGNQMVSAQNNFQNWAANLEGNYANMTQNAQNNYQNWASALESNYANMNQSAQSNYQNWANQLQSNYANMNQTAQNNYQNWANNLTGQQTALENAYAQAIQSIMNDKNTAAYNSANMSNQAAANQSANESSSAYQLGIQNGAKSKKTKEKEKKKKEKENKKTSVKSDNGSLKTGSTKSSTSKKKKKK